MEKGNRQQDYRGNLKRVATNQLKSFTTRSVTPECDASAPVRARTAKGLPDRTLFTHPDRQRAVKNCTIFPLKSPLILRSSVFAVALLCFLQFPHCLCGYIYIYIYPSWKTKMHEAQRQRRSFFCFTNFPLICLTPTKHSVKSFIPRNLFITMEYILFKAFED